MQPSVDHLYVLTLALEEALASDNWSAARSLFDRRDEIISLLEGQTISAREHMVLDKTSEIERRLVVALNDARSSAAAEMGRAHTGRKMMRAYGAA